MANPVSMINEVILVGKISHAEVKADAKAMDLTVDVKTYYSGFQTDKNFRVDSHNVFLVSNTETTREFIERSTAAKKPSYIAVYGSLAERTMDLPEGSTEQYGPKQTYVLARQVLLLSNDVETAKSRAFFQGEIVFRLQKHTSAGKPYVYLIAKNKNDIYDRKNDNITGTRSTGAGITIYNREETDLPFTKGDMALFAGDLESYELRDYPGQYNTGIKSWDWMGTGFSEVTSDPLSADVVESKPSVTAATASPVEDLDDDEDLPF